MNKLDVIKQISNIYTAEISKNSGTDIAFFLGDMFYDAVKLVANATPNAKIALFFYKEEYNSFGKEVYDSFKKMELKPLCVIIPSNFNASVNSYKKMFSLAEDIRFAVGFNCKIMHAVRYFSTIRSIECACVLDKISDLSFLSNQTILYLKEKHDFFYYSGKVNVVLSDKVFDNINAHTYFAELSCNLLTLFDYRIYCKVHRKSFNKKAYSFLLGALNQSSTVFAHTEKEQSCILVKNLFEIELANILSNGIMRFSSSIYSLKLILKNEITDFDKITFIKYASFLYESLFSNKYNDIMCSPDYNARAELISNMIGGQPEKYLTAIKTQIDNLNLVSLGLTEVYNTLYPEIQKVKKLYNTVLSVYFALEGADEKSEGLKRAVLYSGDLLPYVNGMSLLRESGILEMLNV